MRSNLRIGFFITLFFGILFFPISWGFASPEDGTIDPIYKFAWSENLGWINFGTPEGDIHVTDAALTGYAWSELGAWINLQPAFAGVNNDGEGNLSGYAWGEGVGYIDFTGVTIDTDGFFHGIANGDLSGQISFNCADSDTCGDSDFRVRTDWRPVSVRPGGGDGDGGGGRSRVVQNQISRKNKEVIVYDGAEHWAARYIDDLDVLGCAYQDISPDEFITRAELTRMALCTFGHQIIATEKSDFPDISADHWSQPYVAAAQKKQIVHGYAEGVFLPEQVITRAEALQVFCFAAGLHNMHMQNHTGFHDVPGDAWYLPIVHLAQYWNVVSGYQDGTFQPEQPITWGEASKIAVNIGNIQSH